jgi:hypothetical protein
LNTGADGLSRLQMTVHKISSLKYLPSTISTMTPTMTSLWPCHCSKKSKMKMRK